YVILNRDFPPVLDKNFVWWVPQKLDIEAMRTAASKLIGCHDFTSFRAIECQAKSPVKTLDKIDLSFQSSEFRKELQSENCNLNSELCIDFSAKSFLHHQVRNIVGTLVEIGRGKPYDIESILNARDRGAAGPTAPAAGLFFISAEY
ncbi:tRNA pseudouridine synthase A, partial [Candidatus Termititenax aidoneus]